jgi:hypothetical protein
MIRVANMVKQFKEHFPGFMISIDNIPPIILFFSFAPEVYNDNWDAQFDSVTTPGSRYAYPVFKGCTLREIKFRLRFDSSYPVTTRDAAKMVRGKIGGGGSGFGAHIKYSHDMMVARALLEKFKLPKQGIANIAAGVLGSFTKVRPGVSDPAPPLTLLCVNPFKYYVGYLNRANIRPLKYNKWMLETRLQVECNFIVTPDYIFTTLEDVMRELLVLSGLIV